VIINIRGTHGSGKSYLVRRLMAHYRKIEPNFILDSSSRPATMVCIPDNGRRLCVLGHYYIACGGCDTLSVFENNVPDHIYRLVREAHEDGMDVAYEGLIVDSDVNRLVALHRDGFPVKALVLDIPVDICLESIKERRASRGNHKPVRPYNTVNRRKQNMRRETRIKDAGVPIYFMDDREEAYAQCVEWLGCDASRSWDHNLIQRPPKTVISNSGQLRLF
jgi:hypothetical protein